MKKINLAIALALLTISSSFASGKIKVCTQKCEEITRKHFMRYYKTMCRTEEGQKEVEFRIKHAKREALKQSGKKFKERDITADYESEDDLKLISQISPFNNKSVKKGKERIPFSSPLEYGMQCIHQCRTGKVDDDAPKIYHEKTAKIKKQKASKKYEEDSTDDE